MSGVLAPKRTAQMTEFSAETYSCAPPAGCAYLRFDPRASACSRLSPVHRARRVRYCRSTVPMRLRCRHRLPFSARSAAVWHPCPNTSSLTSSERRSKSRVGAVFLGCSVFQARWWEPRETAKGLPLPHLQPASTNGELMARFLVSTFE